MSRLGLGILATTLAVDQLSKWLAEVTLDVNSLVDVLPILALYLTYNTGIAFSFLRGSDSALLLAAVIAVTVIVLVLWARSKDGGRLATVGFALIVGGAIGNIIDRIARGHVVDFLLLHIGDQTIFIFNLADSALTLGPLALIFAYLRGPQPTQKG